MSFINPAIIIFALFKILPFIFSNNNEYHQFEHITSDITLERSSINIKPSDQSSAHTAKVARLWIQSSSVTPGASITMRLECPSENRKLVVFCFEFDVPVEFGQSLPNFQNNRPGQVSFEIDGVNIDSESWYYSGLLNQKTRKFNGAITPVGPDSESSYAEALAISRLLLTKLTNAKNIKVNIHLDNNLKCSSVFKVEEIELAINKFNCACIDISN